MTDGHVSIRDGTNIVYGLVLCSLRGKFNICQSSVALPMQELMLPLSAIPCDYRAGAKFGTQNH